MSFRTRHQPPGQEPCDKQTQLLASLPEKMGGFGPPLFRGQVQDWKQPVRAPSEENQRPRATPKRKLAPVWSGQVQLADPNPIVRDSNQSGHRPKKTKRPRATPKPKLAPVWSGQVQLADPDPIVRDWKQPVRAPSEENYRPRATPKTKLAPLVLTSPASSQLDRCTEQVRGQERTSEGGLWVLPLRHLLGRSHPLLGW